MPTYTTLGELADLIVGFPFASKSYTTTGEGRRLLRGDNIGQGFLRWENAARWDGDADPRYELRAGDLVLAMDRPWVGAGLKFATLREADTPALLVQRVARLRARDGVDQRYLHYLVGSKQFTDHVLAVQTGTAVPHISGAQIQAFRAPQHSVPEQKAIGEVLGALDDKIATNGKAVSTVLDLADAHFSRAVRDVTKGRATFGDMATVGGGGTPKTAVESYWGGDISWATPTDVTALGAPYLARTSRTITDDGLAACASSLYPKGSILMTSRATIGAFAVAQVPTAVNQGFIVVNAHDPDHQWWLFHEMKSRVQEFLSFANGATFLELPRRRFKELPVRTATPEVVSDFGALVEPLHSAGVAFTAESEKLAATRDELLPLLMSGKIRVKDAEKSVEELL